VELEHARSLLGVDASADAETIRRAYLRAIKKTKPERDPEGFQKIREAYELAKRFAGYAPAPVVPSADEVQPANRYDALSARMQGQSLDERLATLRAELAVDGDPEIRRWLFEELHMEGRAEEATALARAAADQGDKQMLLQLALDAPEELTDDELREVADRDAPRITGELIARGMKDEALAVVERSLGRFASDKHPDIRDALDTALVFVEEGAFDEAATTIARLREQITKLGIGAHLMEHDKLDLMLVSDFVAVAPRLPGELRASVGKALRLGDLQSAEAEVSAFATVHGEAAARARGVMMSRTRELGAVLDPWLKNSSLNSGPRWIAGLVLAIPIAVCVIALVLSGVGRLAAPGTADDSFDPDGRVVCDVMESETCRDARHVLDMLVVGDCAAGESSALRLREIISSARPMRPDVRRSMEAIVARHDRECGE
jgi:hypothetical protein